jgi:hypothetical protein
MPDPGNHHPGGEEQFDLTVEVPRDIRHDPPALRAYLDRIARELLDAGKITINPDPDDAPVGGTESVKVTMNVRPCGVRMPAHDDDDDNDDDTHGPPDDPELG